MATLTCPECGELSERDEVTRSAECFCGACDYPLFWAPAAQALVPGSARVSDEALRRLPGVAGHHARVTRPCPGCGEQNPPTAATCLRCNALMDPPQPEPVVLTPVAPPPVVAPTPVPPRRRPVWFWPTLVVSLILVTVLILLQAL